MTKSSKKGAAEGNIVTIADKEGVWYGNPYLAINMRRSLPRIDLRSSKYLLLGHVDLSDTERTIASKDLEKLPKSP